MRYIVRIYLAAIIAVVAFAAVGLTTVSAPVGS